MVNLEENSKTFGDVFESLLGAMFVDRGLDFSLQTIKCPCKIDIAGSFVHHYLLDNEDPTMLVDYKGVFAANVIRLYPGVMPEYKVNIVQCILIE
jgi:hypothetical protein